MKRLLCALLALLLLIGATACSQTVSAAKREPFHATVGGVELTEKGERFAAMILNRHILLKAFLVRLGVTEAIADQDACSMEHILSAETLAKIEEFMKNVKPKSAPKKGGEEKRKAK